MRMFAMVQDNRSLMVSVESHFLAKILIILSRIIIMLVLVFGFVVTIALVLIFVNTTTTVGEDEKGKDEASEVPDWVKGTMLPQFASAHLALPVLAEEAVENPARDYENCAKERLNLMSIQDNALAKFIFDLRMKMNEVADEE